MNRLPGATFAARLQMDYLPGLLCGAHFVVRRKASPARGDEMPALLRAGEAMQRFWLTATAMGLVVQPSLAPLCFAFYGAHDVPFTEAAGLRRKAAALHHELATLGCDPGSAPLLLGRLGLPASRRAAPRSVRRPLDELLVTDGARAEPPRLASDTGT